MPQYPCPDIATLPNEAHVLTRLKTPERVQDFVTALNTNFEPDGDSCWSVTQVMKRGYAHCIEGAFVAAYALWLAGERPLVMDMQAEGDDDHVVAVFRRGRYWGAISKSNHVWLRWRDPVYRSLRELAMSYFHEYVHHNRKTLRRYSRSFDLSRVDPALWVTGTEGCWTVSEAIDSVRHYSLITAEQARRLRRRDAFELEAGQMTEFIAPPKAGGAGP